MSRPRDPNRLIPCSTSLPREVYDALTREALRRDIPLALLMRAVLVRQLKNSIARPLPAHSQRATPHVAPTHPTIG